MTSSLSLSKIIRDYLTVDETGNLFHEPNVQDQLIISREEFDANRMSINGVILDFLLAKILKKYFPGFDTDFSVYMGSMGTYINFKSSNMAQGFKSWLEDTNQDAIKLYRVKPKTIPSEVPDYIGIKFQVFISKDKYFEASAIKEEGILQRLSNSSIRDYVPRFYFGCTLTIPIRVGQKELIAITRLTFTEHIHGYANMLQVLQSKEYIPTDAHLNNIKNVLHKLWRCGISHNDFAAQNIMIHLQSGKIKLIDFGLATNFKGNFPQADESLAEVYQQYYNSIPHESLLDNEGTNVKKLGEFIQQFKALGI
jgi:serine/threonine protein kinase